MTWARAGVGALWMSAAFLVASAAFHILMPARTKALLGQPGVVRIVGVVLCALGGVSLCATGVAARLAAGVLLVFGLRRVYAPERMIETMQWTSRPVHGVLILVGAMLVVVAAVWAARNAQENQGG